METNVMELNSLLADSIIEIEEEHNIWDNSILQLFQEIAERFQGKIASVKDKTKKQKEISIMKKLFFINGNRVNEIYFRLQTKLLKAKMFGIMKPNKQEYFLGGNYGK